MRKYLMQCLYAGITALVMVPGAAFAQQAIINAPTNLLAGPAGDYPVVASLAGGTPVSVMGCVSGYSWCDVALPNLRGWVYAGSLSYPYQGNNVPILRYGPMIGLPIVTFSIGSYWNNYYRGRPWYNNRSRWEHHAPPRPGRPGYRPPGGHPGPGYRPPAHRPPPGHGRPPGARPPGGHPPGGGHGGRPGGGRPPGGDHGRPGGGNGGRAVGDRN